MKKRIVVPSPTIKRGKKRRISRKRQPTQPTLSSVIDPNRQYPKPTLLLNRHYPSGMYIVPPITVPLYWFDRMMVTKGWILSIPPDTFVVDGRRFKVLAQDQNYIGRFDYTRWLVYEEAAVPKGQKP
jgi:hypothetical protein